MARETRSSERRKFNRFEVEIPVQCRPISLGAKRAGRESVFTTIKNISSNGILLDWPREFPLPQFLRLGIRVIPNAKPIETVARKVWANEKKSRGRYKGRLPQQYDVGISFIESEHSKVPRLISQGTDFYWEIFVRTGNIQAYLLHKGTNKGCEEISRDG